MPSDYSTEYILQNMSQLCRFRVKPKPWEQQLELNIQPDQLSTRQLQLANPSTTQAHYDLFLILRLTVWSLGGGLSAAATPALIRVSSLLKAAKSSPVSPWSILGVLSIGWCGGCDLWLGGGALGKGWFCGFRVRGRMSASSSATVLAFIGTAGNREGKPLKTASHLHITDRYTLWATCAVNSYKVTLCEIIKKRTTRSEIWK